MPLSVTPTISRSPPSRVTRTSMREACPWRIALEMASSTTRPTTTASSGESAMSSSMVTSNSQKPSQRSILRPTSSRTDRAVEPGVLSVSSADRASARARSKATTSPVSLACSIASEHPTSRVCSDPWRYCAVSRASIAICALRSLTASLSSSTTASRLANCAASRLRQAPKPEVTRTTTTTATICDTCHATDPVPGTHRSRR